VPEAIDRRIAEVKLSSIGVFVDTLTEEQEKYLSSWNMGT
jgi:adenosylhomocysteinase